MRIDSCAPVRYFTDDTEGKERSEYMITSSTNNKIKNIIQLNTSSKARREQGLFVVEGVKMFLETPREDVCQVFVSESYFDRCECHNEIERYPFELVEDSVLKRAADTVTPQGIICVVRQRRYRIEELLMVQNPLFVILEGLQDPGNLGTILRTGEGAGISGVIMDRNTVDLYNPKVIRATMGSIFRVPFVYAEQLGETIKLLKEQNIRLYAAHLQGSSGYATQDYRTGSGFLIGNEGNGLSEAISSEADTLIRIPMQGQVESLNAAVSASILMYEAARQRNIK